MTRYSACVELLFAEPDDRFADRIRRAAAAGFQAVEFWHWRNRDLDEISEALAETGVSLAAMVAEPMVWLTDPVNHDAFLQGLEASIAAAQKLGAPVLIAQAGNDRPGVARQDQHDAIVACLSRAAGILRGSGVTLALEPLNDRVDHPGYYLTATGEGLDIVDEVGQPEIALLYDIYHSAVMGETVESAVGDRVSRIAHVHLADHPGRHEPGSGAMDWQHRVAWLETHGYDGLVGLEYSPSGAAPVAYPSGSHRS